MDKVTVGPSPGRASPATRKRQLASSRSEAAPGFRFARTVGPMSSRIMPLWPPAHVPAPAANVIWPWLAMFFNKCNWPSANPPPDLPVTNPACPYPSSTKPKGNEVPPCPLDTKAAMASERFGRKRRSRDKFAGNVVDGRQSNPAAHSRSRGSSWETDARPTSAKCETLRSPLCRISWQRLCGW